MTGYPWHSLDQLRAADLNAAFSDAYARSDTANATATAASQSAQAVQTAVAAFIASLRPVSATLNWPASLDIRSGVYVLTGTAPYPFVVTSVDGVIGTNGGQISANFRNNGQSMGNLGSITLTQAAKTTFQATGNFLQVAAGATVDVVISVSGFPVNAYLVLNGTRT